MKPIKFLGSMAACLALGAALTVKLGCGGDFLGLEDYQRDLLGFGLIALLNSQDAGTGDATGDGAGQPVPGEQGEDGPAGAAGADGADGISCWDLNQNGVADLDFEDANGDGVVDVGDCLGADGEDGTRSGVRGVSCWDLNGDGITDVATEDSNGDGVVDVLDCRGADGADGADGATGSGGATGPAGADGAAGADGPQFFSTFIDDFFALIPTLIGDLSVDVVGIREPVLGRFHVPTNTTGDIAYRVAIPDAYDAGNDVTMRLFFLRSGTPNQDCFVFSVARALLRDGQAPVEYPPSDVRQVSIDSAGSQATSSKSAATQAAVDLLGRGDTSDKFLVIDLPLNVALPNGLGFWDGIPAIDDGLRSRDLLAFELHSDLFGGAEYHLLGVEFFESQDPPAAVDPSVALIFAAGETVTCFGQDQ